MGEKKKGKNVKRTLRYYWMAMMQHKIRTLLLVLLVPIWILISNVVVPYGTSQIVGRLSSGDFDLANYGGILLMTIIPSMLNYLVVVRAIDWVDYSIDARGSEFLAKMAFLL